MMSLNVTNRRQISQKSENSVKYRALAPSKKIIKSPLFLHQYHISFYKLLTTTSSNQLQSATSSFKQQLFEQLQ